jgi:glutamyl-tRNA synthetase
MKENIKVRFAPSPTGHLHVGSVRVAIFNWLFARHLNGKYLLRVEDTDVARSKKEYVDSLLHSLKWMNLMPDEEPLFQSSRIEEHKKVAELFLEKKLAYPCFCKSTSVDEVEKHECKCSEKSYNQEDLKKPHAIRFKLPKQEGQISFEDVIRGKITIDYKQLDDFVIVRQDGTPTYNFVVVLDDIFMQITHVIRGEDHISNTPKQILIYQALGEQIPVYAHLPLILNKEGKRLSKRDAVVSVNEYCNQGYLADAMFNYLVRLGWSHGDQEVFSKDELVEFFGLEKVGKKGAIFDLKKLNWLNGVYIRNANLKDLMNAIGQMDGDCLSKMQKAWPAEQLENLLTQYKERSSTLLDIVNSIINFAEDPKDLDVNLISKWKCEHTAKMLEKFLEKLKEIQNPDHDNLLEIAREVVAEFDAKLVAIAQPLRLALCGGIQSPGIFELIAILGKDKSTKRIELLIKLL